MLGVAISAQSAIVAFKGHYADSVETTSGETWNAEKEEMFTVNVKNDQSVAMDLAVRVYYAPIYRGDSIP